jgi:Lrp/AsnC family leucine-responsive transcriptional regulator
MMKSLNAEPLDDYDRRILQELQTDGRLTSVELARRIGLSTSATHTRIRQLEQGGHIDRYVALLNWEHAGFDMVCFVNISLQMHQQERIEAVRSAIQEMPEVLECYHVTGEFDYLLKVAIRNRKGLERFVLHRLTPIPGVARLHTSLALSAVKSTTALPVGDSDRLTG